MACYLLIMGKRIFFSLLSWNAHSLRAKYLLLISKLSYYESRIYTTLLPFTGFEYLEYCNLCNRHVKLTGQAY